MLSVFLPSSAPSHKLEMIRTTWRNARRRNTAHKAGFHVCDSAPFPTALTRWGFALDAAVERCIVSAGEEGGGLLLLLLLELELLEPHDGVELVLRTARGNEESVGGGGGEEGGVSVGGSETFSERI